MSRRTQIKQMRKFGYTWDAIAKEFGVARQVVQKIAARKSDLNAVKLVSYYKRMDGYDGIEQISDEAHQWLQRGFEPSDEMERREASRIRRACTQLRAKHYAEMRGER